MSVVVILVAVAAYIAAGSVVAVLGMRIRPAAYFPKTHDLSALSAAQQRQLDLIEVDLRTYDAYPSLQSDAQRKARRQIAAVHAELPFKEWGAIDGGTLAITLLIWPVSALELLGHLLTESTRRSVNNKTKVRAELEADLKAARQEIDELLKSK